MVGRLFLGRHGERIDYVDALWNDTAEFPYDPPLSEGGLGHGDDLGARLKGRGVQRILVSPFWRTLQTASAANKHLQVPMDIEGFACEHLSAKYFHEQPRIQYNSWAPLQLKKEFPLLNPSIPSLPPYPESHDGMEKRAAEIAKKIGEEYCLGRNENILIVSHNAVAKAMAKGMVPADEFKQIAKKEIGYGASIELVYENGGWHLAGFAGGGKTNWGPRIWAFIQDSCMACWTGPLKQRGKETEEKRAGWIKLAHKMSQKDAFKQASDGTPSPPTSTPKRSNLAEVVLSVKSLAAANAFNGNADAKDD